MTGSRAGWPVGNADQPPVWMDPSFSRLLASHPALHAVRRYLPSADFSAEFEGQADIAALQSSYADRGYGALIYALVRVLRPRRCVEIGLFQGFSLLTAAAALRDNGAGTITGYDLFEDYPYRHARQDQVARQVVESGLSAWTRLQQADVAAVHGQWDTVDYLHVDVSNTGDTYRQVFAQWAAKVTQIILLEGGSAERDNVDWMHQYGKPAIAPTLAGIRLAHPEWSVSVLEPFPSMTVAVKAAALPGREP